LRHVEKGGGGGKEGKGMRRGREREEGMGRKGKGEARGVRRGRPRGFRGMASDAGYDLHTDGGRAPEDPAFSFSACHLPC